MSVDQIGLEGGRWVTNGRVQVWQIDPSTELNPCGTDGGYYRHRRALKEPACGDCKRAHATAEKMRVRRAQRKAS